MTHIIWRTQCISVGQAMKAIVLIWSFSFYLTLVECLCKHKLKDNTLRTAFSSIMYCHCILSYALLKFPRGMYWLIC